MRYPTTPPSRSTEKSWPHFRPSAVDFCCSRLAIGAATERARALAMPAGTRAQAYKRDSSGVAPASPQVADRALLERCIGRPPKKVGRIFGPRRGLRLPAWPRLGHNFANDLAVSIDERHWPLRFIAAERLRGRVKRARHLDRHIESNKIGHAALLLLMLEAADADLVSPSA